MLISSIMSEPPITVDMDAPLHEIQEIFDAHGFHHVLVVNKGKLVGIVSDRDLLTAVSPFVGNDLMERTQDMRTLERRAHQIMTRNPFAVTPEATVQEAIDLLLEEGLSCLPVCTENEEPIGILSWRDLLPQCTICARDAA